MKKICKLLFKTGFHLPKAVLPNSEEHLFENEELIVDKDGISYKRVFSSGEGDGLIWSLKTSSKVYAAKFDKLAKAFMKLLENQLLLVISDVDSTSITVFYDDGESKTIEIYDGFQSESISKIVLSMVPSSEMIPSFLNKH